MKKIMISLTLMVVSCGVIEDADKDVEESVTVTEAVTGTGEARRPQMTLVVSEENLPLCEEANLNQLIYIKESSKFKECNGSLWTTINALKATSQLVKVADEDPGGNCKYGGLAIHSGIDKDDDDVLSEDEFLSTKYTCNGSDAAGVTVRISPISTDDALCSGAGGKEIRIWIDKDDDLVEDSGEVESTYLCNQKRTLIKTYESKLEEQCPTGATVIEVGVDDDRDKVLSSEEIDETQIICNGPQLTKIWDYTDMIVTMSDDIPEDILLFSFSIGAINVGEFSDGSAHVSISGSMYTLDSSFDGYGENFAHSFYILKKDFKDGYTRTIPITSFVHTITYKLTVKASSLIVSVSFDDSYKSKDYLLD